MRSTYFLDAEDQRFDLTRCAYLPQGLEVEDPPIYRMATTVDFGKPNVWLDTLNIWTGGDTAEIQYWQRIVGYCLAPGANKEQALFYLKGKGMSGKSAFCNVLEMLFGDAAIVLPGSYFGTGKRRCSSSDEEMGNYFSQVNRRLRQDVMDMGVFEGKRVSFTHESPSKWDKGLLVKLTTETQVLARQPYQQPRPIPLHVRIFLCGQGSFGIKSQDQGWRTRLHTLHFDQVIPEENRNPNLLNWLYPQLPRILGWAVEGYRKYEVEGLKP